MIHVQSPLNIGISWGLKRGMWCDYRCLTLEECLLALRFSSSLSLSWGRPQSRLNNDLDCIWEGSALLAWRYRDRRRLVEPTDDSPRNPTQRNNPFRGQKLCRQVTAALIPLYSFTKKITLAGKFENCVFFYTGTKTKNVPKNMESSNWKYKNPKWNKLYNISRR